MIETAWTTHTNIFLFQMMGHGVSFCATQEIADIVNHEWFTNESHHIFITDKLCRHGQVQNQQLGLFIKEGLNPFVPQSLHDPSVSIS